MLEAATAGPRRGPAGEPHKAGGQEGEADPLLGSLPRVEERSCCPDAGLQGSREFEAHWQACRNGEARCGSITSQCSRPNVRAGLGAWERASATDGCSGMRGMKSRFRMNAKRSRCEPLLTTVVRVTSLCGSGTFSLLGQSLSVSAKRARRHGSLKICYGSS